MKLLNKILLNKHQKELLKGGGISFAIKIIGLLFGYLLSIFVARKFGASIWGIYSLCLGTVTIASVFGRSGLDTTILRLNAEYKASEKFDLLTPLSKFVFSIGTLFSLIISVLIYISAELIAFKIFSKPELIPYIRISAFGILPFSISIISSRALRGFKSIGKAVFIVYNARFLYMLIIIIIGFYFFSITGEAIIVIFVISLYILCVQSLIWYYKELKKNSIKSNVKINYKYILSLALPLLFASSMVFLKGWLDTIMIGMYLTTCDVGVYNIALKIANLLIIPLTAINMIIAPKFAENINNVKQLKIIFSNSTKILFYISTPLILFLTIFSNGILGFFGREFQSAQYVLIIIAFGAYISTISGSIGPFLQMTGNQKFYQKISTLTVIFSIILSYILINVYGIIGAAISTLVSNLLWNTSIVIYIKKKYGFVTLYKPKWLQ